MSIDARLNKLMPVLSAKERAILVLRAWKEKRPQDPEWRRSMPSDQSREFNRYVTLMNACNLHLPLFITMVEQHSEQMWLRLNWLMTLDQFGSAPGTWARWSLPASTGKQSAQSLRPTQ